ncbi:MAG: hypothetical protein WB626_11320 [Bacteroidota bacterium]
MDGQEPESFQFIGLNIIIAGILLLAAFGYLVLIMRKRWKSRFLHEDPSRGKRE